MYHLHRTSNAYAVSSNLGNGSPGVFRAPKRKRPPRPPDEFLEQNTRKKRPAEGRPRERVQADNYRVVILDEDYRYYYLPSCVCRAILLVLCSTCNGFIDRRRPVLGVLSTTTHARMIIINTRSPNTENTRTMDYRFNNLYRTHKPRGLRVRVHNIRVYLFNVATINYVSFPIIESSIRHEL